MQTNAGKNIIRLLNAMLANQSPLCIVFAQGISSILCSRFHAAVNVTLENN